MKIISALVVLVLAASASQQARADVPPESEPTAVPIKLELDHAASISLKQNTDRSYRYHVVWDDGTDDRLSPDQFAARLHRDYNARRLTFRLLNISSPIGIAWVGLGLFGQVLFTGRMIVQWLVSERHHRSVVPVAFWWMSLTGATMLLIYFAWRKDAVGILGQATGWLIYVRNLWLIYKHKPPIPNA
ncbi:MAG: lipid-A-disaccharide synthase N-terminal domain-containing protein [Phycisphaeraceae bacterium]